MYVDEGAHQLVHFHVKYAEYRASVAIDGSVLEGELPGPQLRLVREWAALHETEIQANWIRSRQGERPLRIDPLA